MTLSLRNINRNFAYFSYFFGGLESWPLFCLFFLIFERCLASNPESYSSKQVRYQLSHPSPYQLIHPSPCKLVETCVSEEQLNKWVDEFCEKNTYFKSFQVRIFNCFSWKLWTEKIAYVFFPNSHLIALYYSSHRMAEFMFF